MSRTYGKILCSIWTDPDWLALNNAAHMLYLYLISSTDVSAAGVAPITERRWVRFIDGGRSEVDAALESLIDAGFVAVDDDTAELWIKAFMRVDGRYGNRKLRSSVATAIEGIHSELLRKSAQSQFDALTRGDAFRDSPSLDRIDTSGDEEEGPSPDRPDLSISITETVTGASSSTVTNPDDAARFAEVIQRFVDMRVDERPARTNPDRYRAAVEANARRDHGDWIAHQLKTYPDVTAQSIASGLMQEINR